MSTIVLQRHANVPLEFDGELIAEVSSAPDGNDRWEEIRIWKVTSGAGVEDNEKVKWVTQRLGKSRLPHEREMIHTYKCKRSLDVLFRMRRQDPTDPDRWYLTDLAFEALEQAAAADQRLAEVLVERI